jgi:hypothetical protein
MKKVLFLTVLSFLSISLIKAQTIMVNSDGTHSIGISHGSTTIVINPDGTHSVGFNHGSTVIAVHPDGTHSIGFNPVDESSDHESHFSSTFFLKSRAQLIQEDSLFTESSSSYKEEVHKLNILIERDIIRFSEYRALKKLSKENTSGSPFTKANQVFDLFQLVTTKAITAKEFRLGKSKIIESSYAAKPAY